MSQFLLDEGGVFTQKVPGFIPREQQIDLAGAIEKAIDEGSELLAEAGTGVGKTYAYLVPAIESGKRVIISTGTKTLQDQLFHRDVPKVKKVLGADFEAALLKGRSNYLCLYRMESAWREGRLTHQDQVGHLKAIRSWSTSTSSGDIMEVTGIPEDSGIWPQVTSSTDNCLGQECPFYDECYVVRARRGAQDADLVVVNHHLLFADFAMKQDGFGEILPGADVFVLDEAHQIPEIASMFLSTSLSSRQVSELCNDILREAGDVSGVLGTVKDTVLSVIQNTKSILASIIEEPSKGTWAQLIAKEIISEEVARFGASLEQLRTVMVEVEESSAGLSSCFERIQLLVENWRHCSSGSNEQAVYWYEIHKRSFTVHATPLDISDKLTDFRDSSSASWIFTSATLAVGDDFKFFADQLGLEDPQTCKLGSPFDYRRSGLLYHPTIHLAPNDPDFTEAVVEASIPVLKASKGRAFMLFTSHRALRKAAGLLEGLIDFPLFVHGDAPRHQLLQDFRKSGNGVLLGAASFWEGIDVSGEALSCVIIDKFPFASPSDPVLEAKLKLIRESGQNPFFTHQLPNAVIALKQGSGRLIRDIHDRGVLMICDPRLTSKDYGKVFLDSLPRMTRSRKIEHVHRFFASNPDSASKTA